jgi:cbb3-type cytochrome oxidase maturation protein
MSVIYVLLPLASVLGIAAVWAFVRATRAGQFDDLETPAHRILHDDEDGEKEDGKKEDGDKPGSQ